MPSDKLLRPLELKKLEVPGVYLSPRLCLCVSDCHRGSAGMCAVGHLMLLKRPCYVLNQNEAVSGALRGTCLKINGSKHPLCDSPLPNERRRAVTFYHEEETLHFLL